MDHLIGYAVPLFLTLIVIEATATLWNPRLRYERRDTFASLAMGVGNVLITLAIAGAKIPALYWLYEHRFFELGTGLGVWVIAFVADDFTYYWFHRASHEVRFLWAAHVNHHSSEHYNLSTALRQSWTTPFTTFLFYGWLPLFGIHPLMVLTTTSVSLIYQFWIHTEAIERLGWFERVFNTPSHHRVHHGSNVAYLDRNHGGILIIWDKLFGTFTPELAPVRYGLTTNLTTFNPVRIAFHEWAALWRDMARVADWGTRLKYVFCPPGWSPDGSTLTSAQRRTLAARVVSEPGAGAEGVEPAAYRTAA